MPGDDFRALGTSGPYMADEWSDDVERALAKHVDGDEVLGLTWLIARGSDVRSGAIGHSDTERCDAVNLDTIFRISSMTKPVTAAVALTLVDDGTIGIDDAVDELLPELADRWVLRHPSGPVEDTVVAERPITVDDLLTFRLGLGGDFTDFSPKPIDEAIANLEIGAGPPAPAVPPEPDEWIRRLGTVPLQYQPGARWLYHTGSDVLGVLVARASGQPFDEFVADRIFEPLGMVDTAFSVPDSKRDRFGTCFTGNPPAGERAVYDPADGQWSVPPAFPGGGAGLVSTVRDFYRFANMLRNGGRSGAERILSDRVVRAMTTNQLTDEQLARGAADFEGATGWGYGVGVQIRPTGVSSVGTYGWDGGLGSVWRNDPDRDVVAVLMTNQTWTSPVPPPIVETFLSVAFEAEPGRVT